MDVIQNSTTGLYTITLGGVLWNNCSTDVDCPGAAVCALNQTWSAFPNMCHCTFVVQRIGSDCLGLGPYGIAFFFISVLSVCSALFWLGVAIFDLYRMIKWRRFKRDALSTSLVFTIAALIMSGIQAAAVARFTFFSPPPDAKGLKDDHIQIGTVGLVLTFLLCTLSMLNVSLVWIQIAENAERVRKASSHNVTRYRTLLITYYFFFFGLMVLSLILGSVPIAAGIAAPGILFVLTTYLYAGMRMRRVLQLYLSSASASGSHRGSVTEIQTSSKNIRDSLRAIQYASLTVSFVSFNFVVWLVVWIATGSSSNRPGRDFNQIALGLIWFWAALAPSAVMWYLHTAIKRKVKAKGDGSNDRRIVAMEVTDQRIPTGTLPAPAPGEATANSPVVAESRRVTITAVDQPADELLKAGPTSEVADEPPKDNIAV